MTRKKASHLMMELMRRIQLEQKGTLKGFGKTANFYRDWKPSFEHVRQNGVNSYKDAWECEPIKAIRASVGM